MTDMLERAERWITTPSIPDCPAWKPVHRTASANSKYGCLCPEALAARQAAREKRRTPAVKETERRRRLEREAHAADPRWRWRGSHTRVDPLTVDFLIAGYRFAGVPPTRREYLVAVWRMQAAGRAAGDIVAVLGVDDAVIWRCDVTRRRLREQRTERRHADAVWRGRHKHGRRTA